MLLSLAKLTKIGGGSATLSVGQFRTICKWTVEPMLVVELEKRNRWFEYPYVTRINQMDILPNLKGHYPSLCYNKILKKWFCTDSTNLGFVLCDALELKKLMKLYDSFNEYNGFCTSPVEAIARWNIAAAMELMSSIHEACYE